MKVEPFVSPISGFPPRPPCRIHPTAEVDHTVKVGEDTVIWGCTAILHHVTIGANVSIGRCSEVGHNTVIGDNTRIGYNVFIPNNAVIGRDVFIGPNVTFCDDMHPRCRKPWEPPYHAQPPVIEDGAAIGAGVVVLPGIHIGKGAKVAAGSIVTKDVKDYGAVRGGPARYFEAPKAWDTAPLSDTTEEQYKARLSSL
jgi:acetyltransferase-like isoleucine patch superfamily enzyme